MRKLILSLALAHSFSVAHAEKGHVHGEGHLDVAIEKGRVAIALELPLDAAVGFERAPRNAKEHAALDDAAKALADVPFAPTAAAKCALETKAVEMPKFVGGEAHADIDAEYVFRCADPAALMSIETTLFMHFRRLYRLEVRRAGPTGQGAARLTPKKPTLSW